MANMVGDIVVDMMVVAAIDVIGTVDTGEADVPSKEATTGSAVGTVSIGNSDVTGGNIMLATERTSRLREKYSVTFSDFDFWSGGID